MRWTGAYHGSPGEFLAHAMILTRWPWIHDMAASDAHVHRILRGRAGRMVSSMLAVMLGMTGHSAGRQGARDAVWHSRGLGVDVRFY